MSSIDCVDINISDVLQAVKDLKEDPFSNKNKGFPLILSINLLIIPETHSEIINEIGAKLIQMIPKEIIEGMFKLDPNGEENDQNGDESDAKQNSKEADQTINDKEL